MVKEMFAVSGNVHVLRDPTRGGVGTALNEIAEKSGSGSKFMKTRFPLKKEVGGACELLGFDPLYLANEGKLLAFVSDEDSRCGFGGNHCESLWPGCRRDWRGGR